MKKLMFFVVYPLFLLGYLVGWMLNAFLVGMFGASEHIQEMIKEDTK